MQKLFHLRIRFFVARLDLNYPKHLHMCIHCDKILPWVSTFIPYNLDLLVLLGSWSIKLFNNVDTVSAGLNDLWYFTWIFLVIRYFYSPWHLTYFFRKYIGHNLWIINITDFKYHMSISRDFFYYFQDICPVYRFYLVLYLVNYWKKSRCLHIC